MIALCLLLSEMRDLFYECLFVNVLGQPLHEYFMLAVLKLCECVVRKVSECFANVASILCE